MHLTPWKVTVVLVRFPSNVVGEGRVARVYGFISRYTYLQRRHVRREER